MAKLNWSEKEQGWICGECGAVYGREEVARCFGFGEVQNADTFFGTMFCMDCGCEWEGIGTED